VSRRQEPIPSSSLISRLTLNEQDRILFSAADVDAALSILHECEIDPGFWGEVALPRQAPQPAFVELRRKFPDLLRQSDPILTAARGGVTFHVQAHVLRAGVASLLQPIGVGQAQRVIVGLMENGPQEWDFVTHRFIYAGGLWSA